MSFPRTVTKKASGARLSEGGDLITNQAAPRLRRSLRLRDLILYGVIIISPIAPMPTFGLLSEVGRGHVVSAILIALVAMLFTGISYGRMANAHPSAGSAFAYVGQEIHPFAGYLAGWGMALDYILNPLMGTIWCAQQSHELLTRVPVSFWKLFYASLLTFLAAQRIRASARINVGMAAAMLAVVCVIFVAAFRYIVARSPAVSDLTRPFYDPATFSYGGLLRCTSIAVLSYIGFDGISTLSEETENPRRNVLLATVLTCVLMGLLSAAEVYVAQLVWPASERFPDVATAYAWVAGRIWSPLFTIVGLTLMVGMLAANVAAQLGAARLLYGMGRSGALPRGFFGAIDPIKHVPHNNVILIGVIVLCGSFLLSFDLAAELLNFGALTAFIGVNAAAFVRLWYKEKRKRIWSAVSAALGFFVCVALWCKLSPPAKMFGMLWMALGIALFVCMTRRLRVPFSFQPPPEQ